MRARLLLILAVGFLGLLGPADAHGAPSAALPRWQTLPLPPSMPAATTTGRVASNGASIYYATYGQGAPVILLHGGMGNGDHFAFQLPALAASFQVIVIDSRGHGRSTLSRTTLSYHGMAGDVIAVMDTLGLSSAAFVGWSDGGAIALDLAITTPSRVDKLFIIGTNYDSKGSKPRRGKPPAATFNRYAAKCRADHARLSPKPRSFPPLIQALLPVWRRPGGFSKDQLRAISVPAMIALGDHDEIIELAHVEEMAQLLPRGQLRVFENTSHFAIWQDPASLNQALVEFFGP